MGEPNGWFEQAQAKLEEQKIIQDGCRRCGSKTLGLNDKPGALFLAPHEGTALKVSATFALVLCQKCGYTEMYSLDALGIDTAKNTQVDQ